MLYDPNWQDKRDIFSTENLIRWLAMQPANERYYYQSCLGCVLALYFMNHGMNPVHVNQVRVTWIDEDGSHSADLPAGWNLVAQGRPGQDMETFGAALARARDLLDIERVISS